MTEEAIVSTIQEQCKPVETDASDRQTSIVLYCEEDHTYYRIKVTAGGVLKVELVKIVEAVAKEL